MDPWDWTVDDVVQNLCYSDALYAQRASSKRPDGANLALVLREQNIDGPTLLNDVNDIELRNDLELKALGERSAIKHVIELLRTRSIKFVRDQALITNLRHMIADTARTLSFVATPLQIAQASQPSPKGPSNAMRTPKQIIPAKRAPSLDPFLDINTAQAKLAEASVDTSSTKKRRLDLTQLTPIKKTTKPEITLMREAPDAFLGRRKVPVDSVFFSDLAADGSVDDDSDDDNFTVFNTDQAPPGRALFIKFRMQYFLQNPATVRNSTQMIHYPYPERLALPCNGRSVKLFVSMGDTMKVSQRDAAILDHPIDSVIDKEQMDNHEWDFLLHHQRVNPEEDEVLPVFGESESDAAVYQGSLLDEFEQEEQERLAKEDRFFLDKEAVAIAIDETITELEQRWKNDKLPKREARAWSTWRKVRTQRRFELLQRARTEIKRLSVRLDKMKIHMLEDEWRDVAAIQKQCASMEVTIFERQEQYWCISVWGNTIPPSRPAPRLRAARKVKIFGGDQEEEEETLSSVSEDDSIDNFVDIDEVPEEAKAEGKDVTCWTPSTAQDRSLTLESIETLMPLPSPEPDTIDSDVVEEDFGGIGEAATSDGQSSSGEESFDSDEDRSPSETRASSSASLAPSSDTILAPMKQQPEAPGKPSRKPDPDIEIIDLTASSPSTASTPEPLFETESLGSLELQDTMSAAEDDLDAHPEKATDTQVAFWKWAKLDESGDRKRIVMKLLFELNPMIRQKVDEEFRRRNSKPLMDRTKNGLKAIAEGEKMIKNVTPSDLGTIFTIAKIWICWVDGSHRCYSRPPLGKERPIKTARRMDGFREFYDFVGSLITVEGTGGKRKRIIKDRRAQTMRDTAQKRRVRGEERRSQLKIQMASSGLAENAYGIMINLTKAEDEPPIYINANIGFKMKDHQIEGVRFLWRELITVDEADRQGCLLAHTMGLGKTMQTITLLVTIAEAGMSPISSIRLQIPEKLRTPKALILCPASLVENWADEFQKWKPHTTENIRHVYQLSAPAKKIVRFEIITAWCEGGGVLIISYDMFRSLVSFKIKENPAKNSLSKEQHERLKQHLLEGPNIVIADEAHKLKSIDAKIAQAASQVKTMSRIALTGSPLANNLKDYYAMIDWVAPRYLGAYEEFKSYYQEPIEAGTYADSTRADQRRSLKKLEALKREIDPKVHRADISVLRNDLKRKTEFVIKVPLTDLQRQAYSAFVQSLLHQTVSNVATTKLMDWMAVLSLLCNHPSIFMEKLRQRNANAKSTQKSAETNETAIDDIQTPSGDVDVNSLELSDTVIERQEDIFRVMGGTSPEDVVFSHKTRIVEQILSESKKLGDKVLIFTHQLPTIRFLERFIKGLSTSFDVVSLDGSTKMTDRLRLCKEFNAGVHDVFIISTTAGGLGLNITGANRVVLMDFSWNPTWEEQAVGRAYRIGQPKPVFVYHLLTGGTYEEKLHYITIFKRQLAARVVDEKKPKRAATKVNDMLFEPEEIDQEDLEQHKGLDSVMDAILASENGKVIKKLETTETLHAEDGEVLDADELKEVEEMIKDDRLRKTDHAAWQQMKYQQVIAEQSRYQARQLAMIAQHSAHQRMLARGHAPSQISMGNSYGAASTAQRLPSITNHGALRQPPPSKATALQAQTVKSVFSMPDNLAASSNKHVMPIN